MLTRRLAIVLLSLPLLAFWGPECETRPAPSILVIMLDDVRRDGLPEEFDPLLREGVRFENAVVTSPVCGPSRANFLTGRLRALERNGSFDFDESDTVAVRMHEADYRTGFFGKYVNGPEIASRPIPPGWDRWRSFTNRVSYRGYETIDERGQITRPDAYSSHHFLSELRDFLAESERPAFAVWMPYAAHPDPLLAIPEEKYFGAKADIEPFRPANYGAEFRADKASWIADSDPGMDYEFWGDLSRRRQLETLLSIRDALASLRQEFPDLVIFLTSDNGVGWGEYAFLGKRCPYRFCFEVPLIAWGPWTPKRVEQPVLVQDVTATVLDLGGARTRGIDGASLVSHLNFGRGYARRSVELYFGGSIFETFQWDAVLSFSRKHIFTTYPNTGEFEIYDLAADPGQVHNLFGEDSRRGSPAPLSSSPSRRSRGRSSRARP